jgi:hypothetical protein
MFDDVCNVRDAPPEGIASGNVVVVVNPDGN